MVPAEYPRYTPPHDVSRGVAYVTSDEERMRENGRIRNIASYARVCAQNPELSIDFASLPARGKPIALTSPKPYTRVYGATEERAICFQINSPFDLIRLPNELVFGASLVINRDAWNMSFVEDAGDGRVRVHVPVFGEETCPQEKVVFSVSSDVMSAVDLLLNSVN